LARITSPCWASIRGSIGGITYLSGPGNPIIARERVIPVDPGTLAQQHIRYMFGYQAQLWAAQTSAIRRAWDSYAIAISSGEEKSGRTAFLSGRTLSGYLILYFAAPGVSSFNGPIIPYVPEIASIRTAAPTGAGNYGFKLSFFNTYGPGIVLLVSLSPPYSPTRNYYMGPYLAANTHMVVVAATATVAEDIIGFDVSQVGQRVFYRVRAVCLDAAASPHRITPTYRGYATIAQGV
jgi:hypothetical protein